MCLLGLYMHVKVYQLCLSLSVRGATVTQPSLGLFCAACCLHRKQEDKRVKLLTTLAVGLSGLWGQLYSSFTQAEQLQEKH